MKLKKMKYEGHAFDEVLSAHRMLIFGKRASPWTHKGKLIDHETAVKVLEKQQGQLPKTVLLQCRVRYSYQWGNFGLCRICALLCW